MQGEQWRSKPNKHGPYLQATHSKGSRRENGSDGERNWRDQTVVTSQFNLTNTVPLICRIPTLTKLILLWFLPKTKNKKQNKTK